MTIVSNDPSWWMQIIAFNGLSYFLVASMTVVAYDWALTFGQEFELVWRQHWSLMTVLYLGVRYIGLLFTIMMMFPYLPSIRLTDAVSAICIIIINCACFFMNLMVGVIMVARLHAMYQRSRKILVPLIVIFIPSQIALGIVTALFQKTPLLAEELVLCGIRGCGYLLVGDTAILFEVTWILGTAWDVLVLFLAVWIAVQHFRKVPSTVTGCFPVLMKTHVLYFASSVAGSCLQLIYQFSPKIANLPPTQYAIFDGILSFTQVVQVTLLGPRLILGLREHHAKLVAQYGDGVGMTSIVFQERIHITTGGGV